MNFSEESRFLNASNSRTGPDNNIAMGVAYLILSILVMVANGIVVFVIAKTKELHMPTLWIIAFMALNDFLYGFHFLIFSTPSAFLNRFPYSDVFLGVNSVYFTIVSGQNIFNTAMTIVDRYIAIKRPFAYPTIATKRNYTIMVVFTLILSVSRLLLIVRPESTFVYNPPIAAVTINFDSVHGRVASISIVFIALALILFCSVSVFRDIVRSRRRIHAQGTKVSESILKFPLMVAISSSIFLLSYVPILASIVWNYSGRASDTLSRFGVVSLLSNSLWNVLIYTASYSPFRDGMMKIFCNEYYRRKKRIELQDNMKPSTVSDGRIP